MRAFILLAHAEIESYLEDIAEEVLDSAVKRWNRYGRVGRCIAALMMYGERSISVPESLNKQDPKNNFGEYLRWLAKEHRKYIVRSNHGIKEHNVLRLLLPLGVVEKDLDQVWLSTISSFGVRRGIVAHKSAGEVQTPPDPQIAQQSATDVIHGLLLLERLTTELKRR